MKMLYIVSLAAVSSALFSLTSCSNTANNVSSTSSTVTPSDAIVLQKSLPEAHMSALHALSTIGAKVSSNKPGYLEGRRPNKMGLMVGSGGETVKIWLTAQGSRQTLVKVKTKKSIVGIAGQKNWDSEVIRAMR